MATKTQVLAEAERLGLEVFMWRPGDGARRYAFGQRDENMGVVWQSNTCSGASEALAWLDGYSAALLHGAH